MLGPCSARVLGCFRPARLGAGRLRRYGSGDAQAPGARQEWTLRVSPFGRLRVRLPCHLAVGPLDPVTHPDGDRVLVAVHSPEGGARGPEGLRVKYDEALQEVTVVSDSVDPRASVEVNAPLKFDLNIKSSGSGCVKVQNLECDNCKIETEQGTSIIQSVKSQKLHVQTKGGKVICLGTVYGNIDIHASDKSTVTVEKLQGSSVNISTEDGLLKAKYLYTESSFLSSAAGDITLGSVHGPEPECLQRASANYRGSQSLAYSEGEKPADTGNIMLQSKMGNITVDSSSGCLKASSHQGAIDVYVSQLGEVELKSHEGSVIVKVPSSLQTYLKLSGKEVVTSPEVPVQEMTEDHKDDGVTVTGLMNQASTHGRWIHAAAPKNTVRLTHQSWFQSLKLQE